MYFKDEFDFLSNFFPAPVVFEGILWPTSEHAYQAMKTNSKEERQMILDCPFPGQAKKISKKLTLRPEWDGAKKFTMGQILRQKFLQHPELQERLECIKGDIVENNFWHDNFWGACVCDKCVDKEKLNWLGYMLGNLRVYKDYIKLVVFGSRTFNDYNLLKERLDHYLQKVDNMVVIVSGKAKGADTLGEKYATEKGFKIKEYPADWDRDGKSAGYIRNEQMAKFATHAVGFWDGKSAGTKHMIDLCEKYGIITRIVKF